MKNITLLFVFVLMSASIFAQRQMVFEEINEKATKNVIQSELVIQDSCYVVYITPQDNFYQIVIAKTTGKPYKKYLGYLSNYEFNDQQVFTNREQTEYWVLTTTKNKSLKKLYLKPQDTQQ